MSNYIKKVSMYTLTALFFAYSTSLAITINGKDITTLAKAGETIVCKDPEAENMIVRIKNGNIEVGSLELKNGEDIKALFNELDSNKANLHRQIAADTISSKSGASINVESAYFSGGNKIIFNAHTNVTIANAILKSKKVFLIGNEFNINGCFINADMLQLEPNVSGSLIQVINFKCNKDQKIPAFAEGHISFEKGEITGSFIVVGAQEIGILFAPKAFELPNK